MSHKVGVLHHMFLIHFHCSDSGWEKLYGDFSSVFHHDSLWLRCGFVAMEIVSLTQQRTFCPLSQEIQPLAPIGCEHLEGFCLNPPDVYGKQLKSDSLSAVAKKDFCL